MEAAAVVWVVEVVKVVVEAVGFAQLPFSAVQV